MALKLEDFEAVLKALSAEGFRFVFDVQKSADVLTLILKKGEILVLEDGANISLKIGNGVDVVPNLRGISGSQLAQYTSADTAEVQATKLWAELQGTARMYEVISKTLPQAVQMAFIQTKPANFSFLLGEAIPTQSGLYQFVQKMPDAKGAFLRNFDHGAKIDPDGDRYFGARQADALQTHAHQVAGTQSLMQVTKGSTSENVINNGGTDGAIAYAKAGAIIDGGAGSPRTAVETRPVNVVTLMLMRIY